MHFSETSIAGLAVVKHNRLNDSRGSFRRLWCEREFADGRLPGPVVQISLSETQHQGTLRGMHFQLPPSREGKLVQCIRGRIHDVAVDLRPKSASFLSHFGLELAATEDLALFIPAGCAHGFLTLTDDCAVLYMMTDFYDPALAAGVRWDDPRLGIRWPRLPQEILPRDADYPDLDPATLEGFADY